MEAAGGGKKRGSGGNHAGRGKADLLPVSVFEINLNSQP